MIRTRPQIAAALLAAAVATTLYYVAPFPHDNQSVIGCLVFIVTLVCWLLFVD